MSVTTVVIEELSKKVTDSIVEIIRSEKPNKDKAIQKICDQCIRYIQLEKVKQEDTEKSIEMVKSQLSSDKEFYTLLLAILYEDLDEDELTISCYNEFATSSLVKPFQEEFNDFLLLAVFFNMGDFSELEKVGLTVINKYSSSESAIEFLWHLIQYVEVTDCIPTFQLFINKVKELFPDAYRIEFLQGFLHSKVDNTEKALESFLFVKDNLEKEVENPIFNTELASIWYSIANCYIKMGNSEKAIECCDCSLSYDKNTENFPIENLILCRKANALLANNDKDSALTIVKQILDENPEDNEALDLLEEINCK
jgi:tetratricopeptide (TPR) repeat protein